jgi:hypothetical protein
MTMKTRKLILLALVALQFALPAQAQPHSPSEASVAASVIAPAAASWVAFERSELAVKGLEASGDAAVLLLEAVGTGVQSTVSVALDLARAAGLAAGTSLRVVAEPIGHSLVAGATVLAFVPNELGRALLHHARHAPRQ